MDLYLFVASVLVIAAITSTRFTQHFGVPALVLFVVIGMLAGSGGPDGIPFENYRFSFNVGMLALAVILLSGGLDTPARLFQVSLLPASLLSTLGVLITMLVVALAAVYITPLSLNESLLLGIIIAPTDAAAVFSVLRGRGLAQRLRGVLEVESGTNDPLSIYLTLALTAVISHGTFSAGSLILGVLVELLLGALFGYAWGRLLVWFLNNLKVDSSGLYPLLVLAGSLCAYSTTNLLTGNGFLTIYIVGFILANRPIPHRENVRHTMDALAWGAQIAMFLLLGLLVSPGRMIDSIPFALPITVILALIARPLAVVVSLAPLQLLGRTSFDKRALTVLAWAGLKGAVPIILATIPLMNRLPHGELIFEIVFVVVMVSATLQGSSVVWLAGKLGLLRRR